MDFTDHVHSQRYISLFYLETVLLNGHLFKSNGFCFYFCFVVLFP